ncbi:TAXI family TRAP transporter solute-binding subunit [Streptomyces sp. S.PB5]|uniref:TAXI family TRAP transporter solute-binding subunit n=1 Tax=Streptomyces sp. S.PB5 TaxID=3020844 RepID=UPI0025B1298D|nr:TAXI family TRAP transporter solute-binding subunit [Streptomyces sp. S.PB5]MDN3021270.1 TAXI family TRAP transporter solute-binding subunit [Streptomyces sp. S.PB5]
MSKPFPHLSRTRALQGAIAGFLAFGLLLWWLLPGEEPPGGTIVFSTGSPGGVYEEYGEDLTGEFAKDMPDLKVDLETSDGSQDNVRRVASGDADFAIAAADAVESYAINNPEKAAGLRGVARLYDDYVQLVVPRDSNIDSVAALKGKRVAIGRETSGVRLIANRVLEAEGIDPAKDITPYAYGIDKVNELGRTIDAFFWSGGLPTNGLKTLAKTSSFKFVPITAAFVAKLHTQSAANRYYRPTNIPESAYDGQDAYAVPTIAVSNLLITREDLDPRLTEWLTRTVIRSRDDIGSKVHSAQLVDLRTAIYTSPLQLHEGARRYYRSVKP